MMKKRMRRVRRLAAACPHASLLIFALLSIIALLLFEVFIRAYDLYRIAPPVDIPAHLLGGFALGSFGFWLASARLYEKKRYSAIWFTLLGAGAWEVLEMAEELVFYNEPALRDIFFWDGFWDIIVTGLGGLIAVGVIVYLQERKKVLIE